MRGRAALVASLLGAGLLSACAPDAPGVGPARIDVDTPALREAKAAAGVADCPAPGTADDAGSVEGGLPDLTLPCFGGGPDVRLADLRGPLVVNVWATSCAPCRQEMPLLQQFAEKYAGTIDVLGIDFQDPTTELGMRLVTDTGVTYPLVADTQGDLAADGTLTVRYLPTTALVAADGTVAFVRPVEITSVQELERLVAEHLGPDLVQDAS